MVIKHYTVEEMGQTFDDYPGFQPKTTPAQRFATQCTYCQNPLGINCQTVNYIRFPFNDTCNIINKGLNYYTTTKNQLELIVSEDKLHSQKYIIHLLTYFHNTHKINAIY